MRNAARDAISAHGTLMAGIARAKGAASDEPLPQPTCMTLEDYFALAEAHPEGRFEYIDGVVRDLRVLLLAGGTTAHAAIAASIILALGTALGDRPCRVYSADVTVRLNASRYVHPDVAVSCAQSDAANSEAITAPTLVVEVLSPSTERFERSRKLALYTASAAIQDYLLVDTQRQAVDHYHRASPTSMIFQTYGPQESVPIAGLDITLPVASFYRYVDLPGSDEADVE